MQTKKMSVADKIKLLSGGDFWHTAKVDGIPQITMSDGPHGLRQQTETHDNLGLNQAVEAICFPSAGCIACSFDKDLISQMGKLLGEECNSQQVDVLLGPAVNIKRSPLCGRNFEYYSEDPCLAGELGASFVSGLQSTGVSACVKHFALNNQETSRMSVSAEADSRTLAEIYLNVFERIMKSSPDAVMSSYNRVNGEYVGESKLLLNDILRKQWGFDGIVISDWYAVNDRVKALQAGLDLEMPGSAICGGDKIAKALEDGVISIKEIDTSVNRIIKIANKKKGKKPTPPYDKQVHHNIAVDMAAQSAVLLKNESNFFPLKRTDKVLFVGKFAQSPRYQGGGSSNVNAFCADGVLKHCEGFDIQYIKGYLPNGDVDTEDFSMLLQVANNYDKIVVFAGLNDREESEGFDRTTLNLPDGHNKIIHQLCQLHDSVAVVLFNGSPVVMPWKDNAKAILEMYLAGEGAGEACARLITGKSNPCGRLAESFPLCLQHNPSYLNFPGGNKVNYSEGVFVGYRYYTTKKIPTQFAFGHGLSYTKFAYSNLTVVQQEQEIKVQFTLTNVGNMAGKEVVQLYVSPIQETIERPCTELKAFDKIHLEVNQSKIVDFKLSRRDFAYFDQDEGKFTVPDGQYIISLNASCEEVIISQTINISFDKPTAISIDDNTVLGSLYSHPATKDILEKLISGYSQKDESAAITAEMKYAMVLNAPLRLIKAVSSMSDEKYIAFKQMLCDAMNNYYKQ